MDVYTPCRQLLGCLCIFVAIFSRPTSGLNCTGRGDGLYEVSCQTATRCQNGVDIRTTCVKPLVIEEETGNCTNYLSAKNPCGTFRDCSFRDDGSYPDLEFGCHWYYLCRYEIFYGHSKCAADLIWNTRLQTCDFKYNVEPPCGTKTS